MRFMMNEELFVVSERLKYAGDVTITGDSSNLECSSYGLAAGDGNTGPEVAIENATLAIGTNKSRTLVFSKSGKGLQKNDGIDSSQLVTDIMRVSDCKTFGQVNAALSEISKKLSFDSFLYRGRFHIGGARYVEQIESNYSESWRQQYEQQSYFQIDPTVSHAFSSLCPLVWSDEMYTDDIQRNFKRDAYIHGLAEGMTLPVHSRNGDVGLLNLSMSRSDNDVRRHLRQMLTWGSLLATLTHEAVRCVVKGRYMQEPPKLSKRETEVLRWVAEGKSTWEISRVIGISEHGVSYHVRNLLLKFDVLNRPQAVAKAVAFGLL